MSIALITFWLSGSRYQHTTVDDLESFLWLLIWCIYCIMEDKVQNGSEAAWLRIFHSPNLETHYISGGAILTHLTQILDPRVDAQVPLTPLQILIRPLGQHTPSWP
jgi:hypothetical protein